MADGVLSANDGADATEIDVEAAVVHNDGIAYNSTGWRGRLSDTSRERENRVSGVVLGAVSG